MSIPKQPMPFFVKPIARALCAKVQQSLIDPNLVTALAFMDQHLQSHAWFAGEHLSMADFQMSFAVEAAIARSDGGNSYAHMLAWRDRMRARPAYQRALAKGGPVLMS
jgi:glutathione S-transferase